MSLRRALTLACIAVGVFAGSAQAQLRLGQEYALLNPPQATDGGGKVEVIEFFSYACGHCYKLEPFLESWVKKLPADVTFKRIPGVGSGAWTQLALMYYSFEAMGKLDTLHGKAFDALHKDNVNLANPKQREAWLARNGVDPAQYEAVAKSFSVQSKLSRAQQLMGSYKVDGVPTLIVNGKYVTSNAAAGGAARVVPVVEQLIAMARRDLGLAAPAPAGAKKK